MLNAIAKPFGWLLMWLYQVIGNYGLAILAFAILVKLILLPFTMKSKRSTVRMSALQPQIKELEKKHGANKQKFNEEVAKLYREEKVNPMGGCLWSLIPFPILIALYQAVRFPLTVMMNVPKELLEEGGAIYEKLQELGYALANYSTRNTAAAYEQIFQAQFINEHWEAFAPLCDKLKQIEFTFLGMDLGQTPNWRIWEAFSDPSTLVPQLLLFSFPILAAVLTWLTSWISKKFNPQPQTSNQGQGQESQAASTMKMMNYMMPLMTLWFGFMMPGAMGLYWLAGMLTSVLQEWWLGKKYAKMLEEETAARRAAIQAKEAELERKRQETEARRAANATTVNPNTSRKKQLQKLRQEALERAAEYERKLLEEQGIFPEEEPSREGDRPFARGRAYDPSRYVRFDDELETDRTSADEDILESDLSGEEFGETTRSEEEKDS